MNKILIIILFCPFLCLAQDFKSGTYITKKDQRRFETDILSFNKIGEFKMVNFACGQPSVGKGKYLINKDTLILAFGENTFKKKNYYFNKEKLKQDSTTINVKVLFEDDKVVAPGVACVLKNRKIGTITDQNGRCTIKNHTNISLNDTLVISFIGFTSVNIPVNELDFQSEITVELNDKFYMIAGEVKKYVIVNWRKKLLIKEYNDLYKVYSKNTRHLKRIRRSRLNKTIKNTFLK